jgi:error-prone DNA polymerase
VKGLHEKEAHAITAQRPYPNIDLFLRKNSLRREILIQLAMGGAFACYGLEPRQALWRVLSEEKRASPLQGELFHDLDYQKPQASSTFRPLGEFETIRAEYGAYSLSTYGHPMTAIRKSIPRARYDTKTAKAAPNGRVLTVPGLILVRQRPPTANGMTFATLEDEFGFLDLAIPPAVWKRVREVFLANCFLAVRGKLQRDTNSFSLLVQSLQPLFRDMAENERFRVEPRQYFH